MRRLVCVLLLLTAALPASARAAANPLTVAVPRAAYPRGFDVRADGVRVVRRAPLTLRGSGRASITITRR